MKIALFLSRLKLAKMNSSRFLQHLYVFTTGVGFIVIAACQATNPNLPGEKRPNILFVVSDDQSWLHAGAYGHELVRTPAFDRIAQEGVLFENSFCTSPSCTPSRSSMLTGQDIWRIGEAGLLFGSIPPDVPLVTHLLHDHGYHVGYTGKGWAPGKWDYLGLSRPPLIKAYEEARENQVAYGIDERDYAENFRSFLVDRKDEQPFFFWFGPTEPHREYEFGVGEQQAGLIADEVRVPSFWPDVATIQTDLADYLYEIMWYDTHLGEMLEILEKIGELDNTLVVATSDNGMPFPRAKVNLYDWGTHMPLAIRWGGIGTPGRRIRDMVSHIDFAPTFLELAGIAIPAQITGTSLLPILQSSESGQVMPNRLYAFTAMERHTWCRPEGATYPMRAIRSHDFLYIRNFESDRWPTGGPDFISSNKTPHGDVDACPTKSFLLAYQNKYPRAFNLCFGKRPAEELYEVDRDFSQVHNLAQDPTYDGIKDSLSQLLNDYLTKTGDPRMQDRDPWQAHVYHQETNFGSTYNRLLSPAQRARARLRPSHHPTWKLEE